VVSWVVGGFGYLVYLRMRPSLQPAPEALAKEPELAADAELAAAGEK
jgi:hypothetical protein